MPSSSKKKKSKSGECVFEYDNDEKVLILPKDSSDNIYEAKILERNMDKNKAQYKIHYKGWNKRWDEWISPRRLLKYNATNVKRMKDKKAQSKEADAHENESQEEAAQGMNEKKRKRKEKNGNEKKSKRRKLNKDDDQQSDEEKQDCMPLDIKLPSPLKRKLIADWEQITKQSQLIQLPRLNGYRIEDILADFEAFALKAGQNKNIVIEISRGIKDYFNQALQVTLLYKLERKQYQELIAQHRELSMCQIYGVEHLCRLFVKLPQLLSPSDLDTDTRKILKQQIEFMIDFLLSATATQKYFDNTIYIPAS